MSEYGQPAPGGYNYPDQATLAMYGQSAQSFGMTGVQQFQQPMVQQQPVVQQPQVNPFYGTARPTFGEDGKGLPYSTMLNTISSSKNEDISYDTSSKDPAMIRARLFVGNINKVGVIRDDLIKLFKPYGRLIALAYFKGYAFVQFAEAAEADMACKKCHGMRFMGTILDCHLAVIGPPQHSRKREDSDRDRDRDRDSSRKRSADDRSDRDREKSRSSKAVKDEFDEVAELNRLNRVAAMNDQTTDDDLAVTEMADTLICGQCRFVTCEYEAFKDHRIAGCARRKFDDEPKRIKCATCNQRFLSCWALLEHLTDFHRMMLFRLEDMTPEEMEQMKNQPAQGMSSMAGGMQSMQQPMQMGMAQMNMQQMQQQMPIQMNMQQVPQQQPVNPNAIVQAAPILYQTQQQQGSIPSVAASMSNSSGANTPSTSIQVGNITFFKKKYSYSLFLTRVYHTPFDLE
ncbi:hypothetical protein WR25_10498 isoform B [Diploscapter pachys]|uniref:RRM domain-containing protein n=1 Tax=Diploscapter pachys TaxID=2018661 RepID=A0A2A2JYB8_9BILA|nr:hypothetical protein WR25_10498 isoform B [Diploscapter pachys]